MRIDETLLNEAKAYAAKNGRSFNSVMEDALRQLINRSAEVADRPETELPISGSASGPRLAWAEMKEILAREDIEHVLEAGHAHA